MSETIAQKQRRAARHLEKRLADPDAYRAYQRARRHTSTCSHCGSAVEYRIRRTDGRCRECVRVEAQDKFIERAIEMHNDEYDYSLVHYVTHDTPVTIICSEHGVFEQKPSIHNSRNKKRDAKACGCPQCGPTARRFTSETWIARAREVHGDLYDYSNVVYVNQRTRVEIICREHGPWMAWPHRHIDKGSGCGQCNNIRSESRISKAVRAGIEELGLEYVTEWTGLGRTKRGGNLKVDFFIPELNLGVEADGRQHFEFFGNLFGLTEDEWLYALERDRMKSARAVEAGVHLLRIPQGMEDEAADIIAAKVKLIRDGVSVTAWEDGDIRLAREQCRSLVTLAA